MCCGEVSKIVVNLPATIPFNPLLEFAGADGPEGAAAQ